MIFLFLVTREKRNLPNRALQFAGRNTFLATWENGAMWGSRNPREKNSRWLLHHPEAEVCYFFFHFFFSKNIFFFIFFFIYIKVLLGDLSKNKKNRKSDVTPPLKGRFGCAYLLARFLFMKHNYQKFCHLQIMEEIIYR